MPCLKYRVGGFREWQLSVHLHARAFSILVLAYLIAGLHPATAKPDHSNDIHPTRIIAKYFGKPDVVSMNRELAQQRFQIRKHFPQLPGVVMIESLPAHRPGTLPDAATRKKELRKRIETLRKSGRFEFVEPDYVLRTRITPSDSAFTSGALWGLRNDSVLGADIQASDAWDITTGSTNVIVAVIDTGVRCTHQDLAAQMWRNPGEIPGNSLDDDHNGYIDDVFGINAITGTGNPADDQGHGTHVAGTIGAAANNGNPHVGIAWNVRLMACKFLDSDGSGYTSDAIEAIDYAIANGARIINASWGGDAYSQALFDAMSSATAQQVLFVSAAGNDSIDNDLYPSYPCSYDLDNVISVAALDRTDKLSEFSNYGKNSVDLGAPGVQIFSCTSASDSSYLSLDGTSMAAPHVTGTAALLLSQFPNSGVLELRQRLLTTIMPIPALSQATLSGGRLNAYNALNAVADGKLEIAISPNPEAGTAAGRDLELNVRVSDLAAVYEAAVVAFDDSGTSHSLLDDNGDAVYSGFIPVPAAASNLNLTIVVLAPGKESEVLSVSYPLLFPPANDNFTDTAILDGTDLSITGMNTGATREAGEPNHTLLNPGGKSVWWSWQSPDDGILSLNTDGSDFDTLLGVYTGTSVTVLGQVASDDDSGETSRSAATFAVTGGETYHIAVDGFSGDSGQINLNLSFFPSPSPPTNDDFVNAIVLDGTSHRLSATNISATREAGEPNHAGNGGGRSVWWTWTPPNSGTATVKTDDSNFDTTLAVYTGTVVSNLSVIAADDDSGEGARSRLSFEATAGTLYRIAVDGYDGAFGRVSLNVELEAIPTPPVNDNHENAIILGGTIAETHGTNTGAGKQVEEPDHAANSGGKSVWWSWIAPDDGRVSVNTFGSTFDTLLAVYTDTLGPVASNDQDPTGDTTSRLAFEATSGISYLIAVDGKNEGYGAEQGDIVLQLALNPLPLPALNDDFSERIPLTTATNLIIAYNNNATKETNEPDHANKPGGKSLWWVWTAPCSGTAIVDTEGSDFDTLLAVYTGATVSSLSPVASDDDSGQGLNSFATFRIASGVDYQIAVDGYRGASGEIKLYLEAQPAPPSPSNDNFAERILITDISHPVLGNNLGSTPEQGEPDHAGQSASHSVWWSWMAESNALVSLDSSGSGFDTILSVYTGDSVENLIPIAANNDSGDSMWSRVNFESEIGEFYHIAVDGNGEGTGSVQLHFSLAPVEPPEIQAHPQGLLVDAGGIAVFTVAASSSAPSTFQWYRNGMPLANDEYRTFGTAANTLVLLDVQGIDIGAYTVEIQNSAGCVESEEAILQVNTAFRLQVLPPTFSPNGAFSFDLGGQVGQDYIVEVSSNLIDWVQIETFMNTNGLIHFSDPASIDHPVRFYRAILPSILGSP